MFFKDTSFKRSSQFLNPAPYTVPFFFCRGPQGCESPPLEWIPTKAFCSSTCFSRYKSSEEGRRLFAEFVLLSTGYLRRLDNCVEPEALPAPKEVPIRGRLQECKIEVPDVPVKVRSCGAGG